LTTIELPHDILSLKHNTQSIEKELLKAVREKKQMAYKGKPIKITADFSNRKLESKKGMELGIPGTE
jgi:hypothetical protein